MGEVVRDGDTVIRPAGEWTPAVHGLLRHLTDAGVRSVPVLIAADDCHEVLSFVPGTVPTYPMPEWVWAEASLESAGRLLWRVHDATAGVPIEGLWRSPVRELVEIICHNDFAPYNLVFDRQAVVGVIDWDYASPGPRLWDVAYLAYRIVPLSSGDRLDGFTDDERSLRLERLIAAYGSDFAPCEVIAVLHDRLLALADFSEEASERLGKPELPEHARLYRYDAARLSAT